MASATPPDGDPANAAPPHRGPPCPDPPAVDPASASPATSILHPVETIDGGLEGASEHLDWGSIHDEDGAFDQLAGAGSFYSPEPLPPEAHKTSGGQTCLCSTPTEVADPVMPRELATTSMHLLDSGVQPAIEAGSLQPPAPLPSEPLEMNGRKASPCAAPQSGSSPLKATDPVDPVRPVVFATVPMDLLTIKARPDGGVAAPLDHPTQEALEQPPSLAAQASNLQAADLGSLAALEPRRDRTAHLPLPIVMETSASAAIPAAATPYPGDKRRINNSAGAPESSPALHRDTTTVTHPSPALLVPSMLSRPESLRLPLQGARSYCEVASQRKPPNRLNAKPKLQWKKFEVLGRPGPPTGERSKMAKREGELALFKIFYKTHFKQID